MFSEPRNPGVNPEDGSLQCGERFWLDGTGAIFAPESSSDMNLADGSGLWLCLDVWIWGEKKQQQNVQYNIDFISSLKLNMK